MCPTRGSLVGLEVFSCTGIASSYNQVMYASARSRVRINNSYSDSFDVQEGNMSKRK